MYDQAVFITQEEYDTTNSKPLSVQSFVERPALYIIAAGSSSVEDQVTILPDRIDCLRELSIAVESQNGVPVTDKLRFFIGDHPAQQFERGTQLGGMYKCGSCGVKDILMDDFAHTVNAKLRSLSDLQALATEGKFGKQPNVLKPFDKLKVDQLPQELASRGVRDLDGKKPALQLQLTETLKGVQYVPTLLLTNPQQSLSTLNLSEYTIVDCEPLHDLKGHVANLLKELPYLLQDDKRRKCEAILEANSSDKMTGGDYR